MSWEAKETTAALATQFEEAEAAHKAGSEAEASAKASQAADCKKNESACMLEAKALKRGFAIVQGFPRFRKVLKGFGRARFQEATVWERRFCTWV